MDTDVDTDIKFKVGKFIIFKSDDNKIGEGAFSSVYKGIYCDTTNEILKNGQTVAIKILSLNKGKIHQIEEEALMMKIIKNSPHPNIVECYDVVEDRKKNNEIYIIMEYCDSGDLRELIGRSINEAYVQFYFSQLANGLKHLDNLNIVHRDIKPRNILLTKNRRILKIADLGLAKMCEENSLYNTMCGSPMYMAPEISRDRVYNNKTDLWSIGLIMYEMLYGFHPFRMCTDRTELQRMVETSDIMIPPKNTKNRNISIECLHLMKNLLQRNVINRISWNDFFSDEWIKKYEYISIQQNNDNKIKQNNYEKQIYSVSLGSLQDKKNKLLDTDEEVIDIEIIDNFVNNPTISIKEDDDLIFEIELDTQFMKDRNKIK
jgi:serine/threonine protein kinase